MTEAPASTGRGDVHRPRVVRLLDAVLDVRLGTVVAPAGSGKTTAMRQWANHASVDVAWYRCDAEDVDPTAVLIRLCDAVRPTTTRPSSAPDLDGLLTILGSLESPLVLVIDDLHLVGPEVVDLFHGLLVRMPAHVHLLTASRTAPPFNLARNEIRTLVVRYRDLRFRTPETQELFRIGYGTRLPWADCERLTRRTDGWPAAIHLFHIQTAGLTEDDVHRAIVSLGTHTRFARDYIDQEILSQVPAELVDFLRLTSVLEYLSGTRCNLLLDRTNSHELLLDLERRGVLNSSAADSEFFCTPPVLRDHLRTRCLDELGDDSSALLLKAAWITTVHPTRDGPAETVRLYADAAAWDDVLGLLALDGPRVLRAADLDWLDSVPASQRERAPWLRLVGAVRAARDGRLDTAIELAGLSGFADVPDSAGSTSAALVSSLRAWTAGDLEPGEHWSGQLRALLRRPSSVGLDRPPASPTAMLIKALGLAVAGDMIGARERLEHCADFLHDDPVASLTCRLATEMLSPDDGQRARDLADRAERLGMTWFARMANGLAEALEPDGGGALTRQIFEAENRGDPWGALLLASIQCAAALRATAVDPAAFEDVVARCHALDSPVLEAWARAGLALASVAANLPDAVRDARSAEGYARSAHVPGAIAVSYGALAASAGDRARELLALAESEAEAAGLACRPWTWIAPDRRESWHTPDLLDTQPIAVQCFGQFKIEIGGHAPDLVRVRPRARSVLRMLAVQAGRQVHKETIIGALWPDLDAAAGTHNLHVCLSSLRALLEPGVGRGGSRLLVRDGDTYALRLSAHSTCDVRSFDDAIAAAERCRRAGDSAGATTSLGEALRLYHGDLLPDDGPAEWVAGDRDHYRIRAAEAATVLAELLLAGGSAEAAAAAALRGVHIDPCRDRSWRLLLMAYEASGDLAAAEQSRRAYAQVLASLGVVSEHAHWLASPLASARGAPELVNSKP